MGQPHRRGSTGKGEEDVQVGRFYLFNRGGILVVRLCVAVCVVRFDEGKSGRSEKPIHSFETELHGYWMKMGEGFFGDSNVTMFITGK